MTEYRNPCPDTPFQFIPHVTINVKKTEEEEEATEKVGIIARGRRCEVKSSVLVNRKSNVAKISAGLGRLSGAGNRGKK